MNAPAQQRRRRAWVTLLTVVRAPLALLAAACALYHAARPSIGGLAAVLVCMGLSAVTDLFDGRLARRWGVVSRFGALADPLMDKLFYVATLPVAVFVALRSGDTTHAVWLLALDVVSMLRDQWVTFLRSVGLLYGADVRANWSGKLRTAIGFPIVVLVYLYLGLLPLGVRPAAEWRLGLLALEAILIFVTLLSAATYSRAYWPHLRRAMAE